MKRRDFLKTSAGFLAALAVAPASFGAGRTKLEGTTYFKYPAKKIGSFDEIRRKGTLSFSYPDNDSPCLAIFVPEAGVVAFSTLCTHKGCPVIYNEQERVFECPCHYSRFDVDKEGQEVLGQATTKLPRVELEVRGNDVYAIGVDGLIWGRASNV